MRINIKKISTGVLATLTVVTPIVTVSCSKKSTIEKIEEKREKLSNAYSNSIKQTKSITLQIDEKEFNGKITNNIQLIHYLLTPEYFTRKYTFFNKIIKNKEVLPKLVKYNEWTVIKNNELLNKSNQDHPKEFILNTQKNIVEAKEQILSFVEEVLSLKEVKIQGNDKKVRTYKIEKEMIDYAMNVILDTWEVFSLVTAKELEDKIEKIDVSNIKSFMDSYKDLLEKPLLKKAMRIIRDRTSNKMKIDTRLDKLIHL